MDPIAKLASSGLSKADATKLRIEVLSAEQTSAIAPQHECPSLKLVYLSIDGKPLPTYRLRLLPSNGAFGQTSTVRYYQTPDTAPAAYLPHLVDWKAIAKDPTTPLVITEGEFKAACATKRGIPTIALGGVWSFKSKRLGLDFLPELESINWQSRVVTICFDSDVATKPQIAAAIYSLTVELRRRGAATSIANLPPQADGSKNGIDDFIVANGAEAFKEILNQAQPDALTPELHRFNGQYTVIRAGYVHEESTGRAYSFQNFLAVHANEQTSKLDAQGKAKRVKIAQEWLEWPLRQTYDELTYLPGSPRIIDNKLNSWRGFATTPIAGNIKPWVKLLDHLFKDAEDGAREWFERWCAYPIAHPGTKLLSACGMWSLYQGQGKSLIGVTLQAIYGENYQSISQEELEGNFNSWIAGKQFVMVDEVSGYDSHHKAAVLKKMITEKDLLVKRKYVPDTAMPACANFYLTSNRPNAFYLDEEDRRYFIHEVTSKALPPQFYADYFAWLNSPQGPAALMHHFTTLPMSDFSPVTRPPMTQGKRDMIEAGRTEIAAWLVCLANDPGSVLKLQHAALTKDMYTSNELAAIFNAQCIGKPATAIVIGRLCARMFPKLEVKIKDEKLRLIVVRNQSKWEKATHEQIRKHVE